MSDASAQPVSAVDLINLLTDSTTQGAIWSHGSEQLNINLVVFNEGRGVQQHVNDEVDVLLIGIDGRGVIEVNGASSVLLPGCLLVIPRGASRSIRSESLRFAYLSCHQRRVGLWPVPRTKHSSGPQPS